MKIKHRFISMILIVCMIITIFPFSAIAEISNNNDLKPVIDFTDPNTMPEGKIISEDLSKRDKNVKQFYMDNHTYQAAIYPYAVHYLENGKWKDIDNRLIEGTEKEIVNSNGAYLENKANEFNIKVSKNVKANKLVSIKKGSYEISWGFKNAKESQLNEISLKARPTDTISENDKKKLVSNINSVVDFKNVIQNIDLQYVIESEGVKENIIINQKVDNPKFEFNLNTTNLVPKLMKDNNIKFYDINDNTKVIYEMSTPFMVDSKGEVSKDIIVSLVQSGDGFTLSLIPNNEWLADATRAYPVTIDPPVSIPGSGTLIKDNFVSQNMPDTNYAALDRLKVGLGASSGKNMTYLGFDLPVITTADMVIKSELYLDLMTAKTNENQVEVHKVLDPWDNSILTWNNKPNSETEVKDYQLVQNLQAYKWDVTPIVRDWYVSGNNYGLMLKDKTEAASSYTEFYSSNATSIPATQMPRLTVNYVNASGLESYWSTQSLSAGRAGTAFVNNFNGNLTFIHNDMNMNGNRMPVSINHIFNSSDKTSNLGYGNGWRLNINQLIFPETIDTVPYLVYVDEDRTRHYFKETATANVYEDQSGLNLTLTVNTTDNSCTIKDKYDNLMYFVTNGDVSGRRYLKTITDSNNNKMTIGYNGTVLATVSDGVGRTSTLNYTNGLLTSITDPFNRTTSYSYTGNNLTKITYPDAKYSSYNYDGNNSMLYAVNIDNYKLTFSNYTAVPYRVKTVQESNNATGIVGNNATMVYGNRSTKVTDIEGNSSYYDFNDYGNTVSTRNDGGYAQYFKYGTGANTNKTTFSSKTQRTVINLLKNHNLEGTEYWVASNTADSTGSSIFTTEDKYYAKQSIKISKTNNLGLHSYQQSVDLIKGNNYTFSGYVKTVGISNANNKGAYLYIAYQDSTGAWKKSASKYINGTQAWQRLETTFTLPTEAVSTSVHFKVALEGETGTVYFDGLQVEDGSVANRYNLIENADFTNGSAGSSGSAEYWSKSDSMDNSDIKLTYQSPAPNLDNNNFKITGAAKAQKNLYQHIYQSGTAGDVYTLGGWGKANSLPVGYPRTFAVTVGFTKLDGTVQWETRHFNRDSDNWQYLTDSVTALSDYSKITVFLVYYENINVAYFDGIQLYKEETGQNIVYDAKGNVEYVQNLAGKNPKSVYDVYNNLTTYTDEKDNVTSNKYYTQYAGKEHLLEHSTTPENIRTSYTHDNYGNTLTARINNVSSQNPYIGSSTTYTTDGNYVKTFKDASGNTGSFDYHTANGIVNGNIKLSKDSKNYTTNYEYDSQTDTRTDIYMQTANGEVRNNYGYVNDKLKNINHNGFSYGYEYDDLGNLKEILVGTQKLIINKYTNPVTHVSKLDEIVYLNGDNIKFDYSNKEGTLTTETHDGIVRFNYEYDSNGNLGYISDLLTSVSYRYFYDTAERLIKVSDSTGNLIDFSYEANNNLDKLNVSLNGIKYATDYNYNKDNRVTDIIFNSAINAKSYSYDGLGRLSQTQLKVAGTSKYTTTYGYKNGIDANSTTQLLDTITNGVKPINYTYDANGNINTIIQDGKTIKYYYDELNQIKREDNQVIDKTIVNAYDNGGNILSKTNYAYTTVASPLNPTSVVTYGYTDPTWKDKLTSFNGGAIGYDASGNIQTAGSYTYNWKSGTELDSMVGNGQTISFEYNQDGIRTEKKIVTGVTTKTNKYQVLGDKVLSETNGTDNIHYTYGANDKLVSMNLNGVEYYYIRNGQSDIIGLVNNAGTEVVSYTYDTWGNLFSTSDSSGVSLATKNPYRYRGYRYDTETGLYYLNSRYYNPYIGRFMSADAYMGNGALLSHNLYTYARNNPVNFSDPNGYDADDHVRSETADYPAAVWLAEKWIVEDVQTLMNGNSTLGARGLALLCLAPVGRVSKMISFGGRSFKVAILSNKSFKRLGSFLKFGSNTKSASKLAGQMALRGWDTSLVKKVVNSPFTTRKSKNLGTGNLATAFYMKDGNYVVVDDITKEVVQISHRFDTKWAPDVNIINPYKP